MKDLTFYTNPMSRGRIVRWMLEEVGEPYHTVLLDFASTMKDASYLALNPMGKVPVIRHGDTVVSEAAAICAYLADAFPKKKLAPPVDQRGAYYRRAMAGYGTCETTMETLEAAVAGREYVAGDHFTAADVYVGSQIGWGLMFGTIDKRKAFEDYVGRLRARPAAQRASATDDAAMPKKT